jgi:hypothetical protein
VSRSFLVIPAKAGSQKAFEPGNDLVRIAAFAGTTEKRNVP